MCERFKVPSASILMLVKVVDGRKKVLFQRRHNTGFADGMWDLSCSGHVERGESMRQALVREAKEELGITVSLEALSFFALVHKHDEEEDITYYNAYFSCDTFEGEPQICEREKCSQLEWMDIDDLPKDLIEDRRLAVKAFKSGTHYFEYGWQ